MFKIIARPKAKIPQHVSIYCSINFLLYCILCCHFTCIEYMICIFFADLQYGSTASWWLAITLKSDDQGISLLSQWDKKFDLFGISVVFWSLSLVGSWLPDLKLSLNSTADCQFLSLLPPLAITLPIHYLEWVKLSCTSHHCASLQETFACLKWATPRLARVIWDLRVVEEMCLLLTETFHCNWMNQH